ncbi:hypothetical protein RKD24_002726 [Streptomyces calvus]|jgi:hypothetical protein|uniref:Lipoprotein n=1 Tax=Streptomyces calvus TaxID=67282 RepID=A0A514JTI4_9ACTN|nr:hypothetical protein [Streptomyces calvus]QDI70681.1 hypothetical protein CD934_19805 [Streptomyces calvus]
MRRTALAGLCLVAVSVAALTGCAGEDQANGGSSNDPTGRSTSKEPNSTSRPEKKPFAGLTGGEIADKAFKATAGASSLRMSGDVPDEESGGTIRLDMALNEAGDCSGTMGFGKQGEAELIKTGDVLYLKYDEAFLRAQSKGEPQADVDAAVALLAGKWAKMSTDDADAEDLSTFCDLDMVFGGAEEGNSAATRGRTTTVDGAQAVTVEARDGKDHFTLYVATEGEPYLLRLDSASADDPGSITFSDYGKSVPLDAPKGNVLDLDSLS